MLTIRTAWAFVDLDFFASEPLPFCERSVIRNISESIYPCALLFDCCGALKCYLQDFPRTEPKNHIKRTNKVFVWQISYQLLIAQANTNAHIIMAWSGCTEGREVAKIFLADAHYLRQIRRFKKNNIKKNVL